MKTPSLLATALTLSLTLAACGGGNTNPDPQPQPNPNDTTAPSIVSVSPSSGASGVNKSSDIVVTFSEPMNQASAQAAFQSANLGAVTFTWNADSTVMTVNPNNDLEYTSAGKSYSFAVTTTATDRAGNALSATQNVSFATFKRITTTLKPNYAGEVFNDGVVVDNFVRVGDYSDNAASRGFISFKLDTLPSRLTDSNIQSAVLRMNMNQVVGKPTTNLFESNCSGKFCILRGKSVGVESVSFGSKPVGASFDKNPLLDTVASLQEEGSSLILIASTVVGWNTASVTEMVKSDWLARSSRNSLSQFRLKFPKATNADGKEDRTYFDDAATKSSLSVTYLIP